MSNSSDISPVEPERESADERAIRPVIIGASGMVGGGILRECLNDSRVSDVTIVVRHPSGISHSKLREVIHADLFDAEPLAPVFADRNACFYALGVTSSGLGEPEYRRVTLDLTIALATVMHREQPEMTFCFISGQGTDGTEHGRVMWARVKGAAENALQQVGFRAVYSLRPGFIQPLHGARSRTASYRILYQILGPVVALLRRLFPNQVTSTAAIGQAMLNLVERGYPKRVLESRDIERASQPV